jgi:hypothetical protein
VFLRGKERAPRVAKQYFPELACAIDDAHAVLPTRALGFGVSTTRVALPHVHAVHGSYPALAEMSSLTDAQARTAGKDLKTAVSKHYKALALLALDAPRERVLMVLSGQKGAGAYLTVENPLRALADAEKDKAAKYNADKPACSTYITFAQGTQCELGVHAVKWLHKWALDVAAWRRQSR